MLFIIAVVVVAWVTIYWFLEDSLPFALFIGTISALMAGLVLLPVGMVAQTTFNYDHEGTETVNLRSMGDGDGISGRSYFLGGGYIESKKVINYIGEREDGGVQLSSVDASDSVIYEREGAPILEAHKYSGGAWWYAPFKVSSYTKYEFSVPNGTVVESYELSTK